MIHFQISSTINYQLFALLCHRITTHLMKAYVFPGQGAQFTGMSKDSFAPDMVAGHSLGEFSALVANKTLSFADALLLVSKRAMAMQKACEMNPSTMAAVLGMDDAKVEEIFASVKDDVFVAANYNCPGQLVISG